MGFGVAGKSSHAYVLSSGWTCLKSTPKTPPSTWCPTWCTSCGLVMWRRWRSSTTSASTVRTSTRNLTPSCSIATTCQSGNGGTACPAKCRFALCAGEPMSHRLIVLEFVSRGKWHMQLKTKSFVTSQKCGWGFVFCESLVEASFCHTFLQFADIFSAFCGQSRNSFASSFFYPKSVFFPKTERHQKRFSIKLSCTSTTKETLPSYGYWWSTVAFTWTMMSLFCVLWMSSGRTLAPWAKKNDPSSMLVSSWHTRIRCF